MRRDIFTEEHEAFRDLVRKFLAREATPFHAQRQYGTSHRSHGPALP